MKTMTCAECIRARQRVVHRVYTPDCVMCEARRVAYMPREEREKYFDKVQHLSGMADRLEAIRVVNLERARIKALDAAMPKKEKA